MATPRKNKRIFYTTRPVQLTDYGEELVGEAMMALDRFVRMSRDVGVSKSALRIIVKRAMDELLDGESI